MAQQLTDVLKYFLDDYIPGKRQIFGKGASVYNSICGIAPQKIYETNLVEEGDYKVVGSVGQGVWAKVPWLAIFKNGIAESAQEGVYIVYLLSSDGNSLYLTLNQGVTELSKNATTSETLYALRKNARELSSKLNGRGFSSDENISLGRDITDLGKKYEKGTIFYKRYSKSNRPSENQLKVDLQNMIEIYEEYAEKFNGKSEQHPQKETSQVQGELNMNVRNAKNKIFFGAPGTGKSYKIDFDLFKDDNGLLLGMGIKELPESRKFRTTFHPDYDYAQFVGAYKPKLNAGGIIYTFVPQVFAKAYAAAWTFYLNADSPTTIENQIFLVIEEINRGNCAQIFGDIFQLLDRDGEGFSQYSIDADCDFAEWLETNEDGLKSVWDKYKKAVGEGKLKLPPNLNILATMNTSDQSLFPMDSAFKRRFDWEYVPISFDGKDAANFQIDIDGTQYSWQKFVETVNGKILDLTESEDKQLGEFFIKPDNGNVISKDRFLGKVIFYLWNEVCKDEHKNGSFFRTKDDGYFTFQDLYKPEKKDILNRFMAEIGEK